MPSPSGKRRVDVHVFPAFRPSVRASWVRRAAAAALDAGDPEGRAGVSVVIADDETLHDLNRRFRGIDEVTDVLAFGERGAALDPAPEAAGAPGFPSIPGETPSWGEVVVSYPLAARQAGEHNATVAEEAALLIVHGVLHLLGHDHAEPDEEAAMKALEATALGALSAAAPDGEAR